MLLFVFFLLLIVPNCHSIISQILNPVSIYEETPLGTIVVDLRPTLQTLGVRVDQAALLHSQSSQPFEYINGRIRLKGRLDREDYVRKRLCAGGNVLECNFTLTLTAYNYILSQPISCYDINDIIPRFSQSEATISMAENVPVGHRIPLETAVDLDSPPFGIANYHLTTMDGSEQQQFAIVYDNHSRELELIVREKLDRERTAKYLFKLMAIDRGNPPNIGTQILNIEIIDVNDSRPRFESSVYNVSVAENTLPEYLLKVRAIDADIGSNAELTYTLENDHHGLFRLDKTTGVLTLTQALDYELHTSYQLKVEVRDSGALPLSDTCTINLFVLDQNDHAPSLQMKFNPILLHNQDGNMAYVPESFDINLPLVFVTVRDQDSGENGKAKLTVEPNRSFYLETIRPDYYAVKAARLFDRETTANYQIELRARDFGQPPLRRSMTLELNITDINDQKPLFPGNYTFDLAENNRIPSVVGQVLARDADQGLNGQVSYAIIPPSSLFMISSHDGILSTNHSFDYELQHEYHFKVRARDAGQPPLESFVNVRVKILNVNEFAPEFDEKIYRFMINENITNKTETFIGRVHARDRDRGDGIVYSLAENNDEMFSIDHTGAIWTRMIFDREFREQYKMTVLATDNSSVGTIGSAIVILTIKDINDNPPIFIWPDSDEIRHVLSNDRSQRIDGNHPLAQFITDIVVRDNDTGNNSIVSLSLIDDTLFYIGSNNSLWLRNTSIIPGTYDVNLLASNFELQSKKLLHIIIFDYDPLGNNLLKNMSQTLSRFSVLIIMILSFVATGSAVLILVYYLWTRIHYTQNMQRRLYGSRLIVNDEDKSKQNSPQTTTISPTNNISHNADYAVIVKQRKQSGVSPSSDGEFSSSLLSCPFNGTSSSTSDIPSHHHHHHNPPSATVSALTTLARKSTRRQAHQTKNVSFQPTIINPTANVFDDLFQHNPPLPSSLLPSLSYHECSASTFSTLPRQNKRILSSTCHSQLPQPVLPDFPKSRQKQFPTLPPTVAQPPPLLDGILLLDQMLSSNDEKTESSSSGWYNVTSQYQTRASIV